MPDKRAAGDSSDAERRILYFADPMCSWCWGFAPVMADLVAAIGDESLVRLVLGGLRAGETRPMSADAKAYVRHHWEQVQAATGQPFAFEFFDRDGFVYDTEPACRACVVMRTLASARALDYFRAVQHAFYAENRDVTVGAVLAELAAPFGVGTEAFGAAYEDPEALRTVRAHFHLTQTMGVGGFPTVILRDAGGFALLTAGYQPFEQLAPILRRWLQDRH